jgi:hypothetical protein
VLDQIEDFDEIVQTGQEFIYPQDGTDLAIMVAGAGAGTVFKVGGKLYKKIGNKLKLVEEGVEDASRVVDDVADASRVADDVADASGSGKLKGNGLEDSEALDVDGALNGLDVPNSKSLPNSNASAELNRQYSNLDLNDPDAWCTECAVNLYRSSNGEGKIVVFSGRADNWPADYDWGLSPSDLNVPLRDGQTVNFAHHSVYTDGRYIYDPFVSKEPIPQSDYLKILNNANPEGVSWRVSNPDVSDVSQSVDGIINSMDLEKGKF